MIGRMRRVRLGGGKSEDCGWLFNGCKVDC
jgi:hypothetical protein